MRLCVGAWSGFSHVADDSYWESYFLPGTTVLRNLFDEYDQTVLNDLESEMLGEHLDGSAAAVLVDQLGSLLRAQQVSLFAQFCWIGSRESVIPDSSVRHQAASKQCDETP